MKKKLIAVGVLVTVAALLATTVSAKNRGVSFTPIGLFPTCDMVPEGEFCENFPLTTVVDMTGDGQTIVGMHAFFSGNYIWTAETGLNTIGPVTGAPWIARDGSALASTPVVPPNFDFSQSAYWTGGFYPDQTWDLIPLAPGFSFCDSSGQSTYNISDHGDVVVGLTWVDFDMNGNGCDGARAFSSTGGVTTVLDDSVNNDSSRANAVNADGSVVIGWMQTNQREAAKWVDGVQSFLCPSPIGEGGENFCSEGWDVTPDGSLMLTSMATPEDFNTRATLVDQAGNFEQLPFPDALFDPFWDSFKGWAISDDGNTVVGEFGGGGFFGSPPYPVLWNRDLGYTVDVQVFLIGQGLDDLFFWFLSDASAVNSDGTIIAGSGTNPDGWIEGWTADISKVKVCHKPDGNGEGNQRTLTIGWESVPDHLAHGDILATCEFAIGDGGPRAIAGREMMVNGDQANANHDERIRSMEEWDRILDRVSTNPFSGVSVDNPYNSVETGEKAAEGGQTPAHRNSLERRMKAGSRTR